VSTFDREEHALKKEIVAVDRRFLERISTPAAVKVNK